MNNDNRRSIQQEYLTKTTLIALFLGVFAAFVYWQQPDLENFHLSALDLALLGLAVYRLGRLIAYDVVMEPLRRPFTQTVPDGTGAGESVEPRGTGVRRAIGQLISCPICAGTWVAALLVYALYAFPGPARVFILISAAIGLAEMLNSLTEILCWSGQYARTLAGIHELSRKSSLANGRSREAHSLDLDDNNLKGKETQIDGTRRRNN